MMMKPVHRAWGGVAAAASGWLAGFAGMGGPPLVLFAFRQGWPMLRVRTFLWGQFLFGIPAVLAMLTILHGPSPLVSAAIGLALGPVVIVGVLGGGFISTRVPDFVARNLGLTLLATIASIGVCGPSRDRADTHSTHSR